MAVDSSKGFGIIADDLTGAMDAGAGFLGLGLHPFVTLGGDLPSGSAMIVISTDSRDIDPEAAYRKVRRQARRLAGLRVYKKIDSTLRGNIGREIMAVMDALGFKKALVCPAFPANGRTVLDGRLMVGNVPIDETPFAKGPPPISDASIPVLLQRQTGLPIGLVTLEQVSKGPGALFRGIQACEQKIVVVDATDDSHLRCIAESLFMSAGSWLPCGSAGLARELPRAMGYAPAKESPFEFVPVTKPVLAVVGSRNPASVKQVETAAMRSSLSVIYVQPGKFVDSRGRPIRISALIEQVGALVNRGQSVVITTALSPYVPWLKEITARLLARVAAATVIKHELAGLVLTGGDIARETCRSMHASGIRILKELEPGVIFGEAIGTAHGSVRIVTKAGGFGGDKAVVDAVSYLRGDKT